MKFEYPDILWLLTALPILGILFLVAVRRARRSIELLTGDYRRKEVIAAMVVRYFLITVLFTGSLVAIVFAIAEPKWGERTEEDDRTGLEIAFLLDVSNSMRAEDVSPSRLARARAVARGIAGRFPEAHKAVVVFKGNATVLVPMTQDDVSFELAMSNLSGALVTSAGTNIAEGLSEAIEIFPSNTPHHRVVVFFSDGEQLQDSIGPVADRIRAKGIPILVVATGTDSGATVPLPSGGVLTNENGDPIIVSLDRETLQWVADASGGRLYRITDAAVTQHVADAIQEISGSGADIRFRRVTEVRYHLFVLVGLIFLTATVLIKSVPWWSDRRRS